jgi:hypothetical protein
MGTEGQWIFPWITSRWFWKAFPYTLTIINTFLAYVKSCYHTYCNSRSHKPCKEQHMRGIWGRW